MNTHRSSAGRDYALGGVLIVLAAASLYFLHGATAVFIAVIAVVAGAVLIIKGIQASGETDADFQRGFGEPGGNPGSALGGEPRHR